MRLIKKDCNKILMKMNLKVDNEGCIYFNDVLYQFMKRYYEGVINIKLTEEGIEMIKKVEGASLYDNKSMKSKNDINDILSDFQNKNDN